MSMSEALRHLRGAVPWLSNEQAEFTAPPVPPTPEEEAESIVEITRRAGRLDRESPTWAAVAKWAATELIKAQRQLETADGDKAAALRSRCKTLRDLLEIDKDKAADAVISDPGPDIP
jgi:ABC-type branched-subunit amino acid transport system substrate-binding protein